MKKKNKKVFTVNEAKHEIIKFLFMFSLLPRTSQLDFILKLVRDGWY